MIYYTHKQEREVKQKMTKKTIKTLAVIALVLIALVCVVGIAMHFDTRYSNHFGKCDFNCKHLEYIKDYEHGLVTIKDYQGNTNN